MSLINTLRIGLLASSFLVILIAVMNIVYYTNEVNEIEPKDCWKPHLMMICNVIIIAITIAMIGYLLWSFMSGSSFGKEISNNGAVVHEYTSGCRSDVGTCTNTTCKYKPRDPGGMGFPHVSEVTSSKSVAGSAALHDTSVEFCEDDRTEFLDRKEKIRRTTGYANLTIANARSIDALYKLIVSNLIEYLNVSKPSVPIPVMQQAEKNVEIAGELATQAYANAAEAAAINSLDTEELPQKEVANIDKQLDNVLKNNRALFIKSSELFKNSEAAVKEVNRLIECELKYRQSNPTSN